MYIPQSSQNSPSQSRPSSTMSPYRIGHQSLFLSLFGKIFNLGTCGVIFVGLMYFICQNAKPALAMPPTILSDNKIVGEDELVQLIRKFKQDSPKDFDFAIKTYEYAKSQHPNGPYSNSNDLVAALTEVVRRFCVESVHDLSKIDKCSHSKLYNAVLMPIYSLRPEAELLKTRQIATAILQVAGLPPLAKPGAYPNRATASRSGTATASVGNPKSTNGARTVLGIPLGSPLPKLPKCDASRPKREWPALCYGVTQGILNNQPPVKWNSYTITPVTPSIRLPGFEFPELLENNFFPGFFVVTDQKGLLQGLFINSVTDDATRVIAMLNARFGSNMKTVVKKTEMSPGEVVSVFHYYWTLPGLVVHYGPPSDMPMSAFKTIEVLETKLMEENENARAR